MSCTGKEPLAGVTVQIAGKSFGTATDSNLQKEIRIEGKQQRILHVCIISLPPDIQSENYSHWKITPITMIKNTQTL